MATTAPNLAFRFFFPSLTLPEDQPMAGGPPPDQSKASPEPVGLQLGLHGSLAMISGDDSVRQAVLLLLSTRPGERVMRPNYGCNLHSLVFAPNDDTTAAIAIHHIRQALLQWEPRIDILDLEAHPDPQEPNVLAIVLKYRVRITHQTEELHISQVLK